MELRSQPKVFEHAAQGGGGGAPSSGRDGSTGTGTDAGGREQHRRRPEPGEPVLTDEQGKVVAPARDLERIGADPAVRMIARQIAARLAIGQPRSGWAANRGTGRAQTVPFRATVDDIDLDRTLDALAEHPLPRAQDVYVRERISHARSVVLGVDVSGSMGGERVRTAAAAVGALSAKLTRDHLGVLAFWSDVAWLAHLAEPAAPQRIVDVLLDLPARGMTNIAFPIELAAGELRRLPARDSRLILLTDGVHNAGPDPRDLAVRLPRLDILLDVTGEHDLEFGRELARIGRGTVHRIRGHRDVAPALNRCFRS